MTLPRLVALALAAVLLTLHPAAARAATTVGFTTLQAPDPQGGAAIDVGVWYPADAPEAPARLGLAVQLVAQGAPLVGDHLPLIVMSHGNGGWYGGHDDTARALARAGFVVAALTHTGDNYADQSRATDMANRPRQLHVLIDYMLSGWARHGRLDAKRVGAFGFSSGGFTVLAAAGGEPDLSLVMPHCQAHPDFYDCQTMKAHPPSAAAMRPVWVHDSRIKAVVAAAPALGFTFTRAGLSSVRQPLQLWRAGDDQVLPHPFYAEAVRTNLPRPPETHVVPGAGHFDFLNVCPDALAAQAPVICHSAPGFDRAAFHETFDAAVVAFFKAHL